MVVNADKDREVLKKMEERWKKDSNNNKYVDRLEFCIVDFAEKQFPYEANAFDLVLDKSTLDCTLCSDNATASLLVEIYRCLAVDDLYLGKFKDDSMPISRSQKS